MSLKILVKVAVYNFRNGAIRWLVSASIMFVLQLYSLAHTVFQISYIYIYIQKYRNGVIPWLVSTSIKVVLEHFSLAHIIFQILYIYISRNLVTLKVEIKVTMYNIRNGAIRWQIPDFLSDGFIHVCSISRCVRDIFKIFAIQNECQNKIKWSRSRSRSIGISTSIWKSPIPCCRQDPFLTIVAARNF